MGEFKFACPVCGQHITAATSASGTQLECPTCFRKIIVPQAPASGDSKLILSASQADKPRPLPSATLADADPYRPPRQSIIPTILLVVALLGIGGAAFLLRGKILGMFRTTVMATNNLAKTAAPRVTYPIPTNISWTLGLSNAVIPEAVAVGTIHGEGFFCERASLTGGNLLLRQGRAWPPDLGINIIFFAKAGEELSGKTVEIGAERVPPLPKVTLRWKDAQNKGVNENIASGYALKVVFGPATNGRITGKLYIGLPDGAKSFVAGTFDAEIRKPPPPKAPKAK